MAANTVVYLLRHGQSEFNEALAKDPSRDPMLFDPPLTARGRAQAVEAGHWFRERAIDLVVTSPFVRTLQTTQLAFGSRYIKTAVGSLHREVLEQSGDIGSPKSRLAESFPEFDFCDLPERWWYLPHMDFTTKIVAEPEELVNERMHRFRIWLGSRSERCIVVVGHGGFFRRLTGRHLQNGEHMEYLGAD